MKSKFFLLIFSALLWVSCTDPDEVLAQSVPNTNNFSEQDVVNVTGSNSLDSAFILSVEDYFDAEYKGNMTSLYNFRNYKYPAYVLLFYISDVTTSSFHAYCQSNENTDDPITERGICWNTSPNPTISGSHTSVSGDVGAYDAVIGSLSSGTRYYVRAYASTAITTMYSNELLVTTLQDASVTAFINDPYIKIGYIDCPTRSSGNPLTTAVFRSGVNNTGATITNSGLVYSSVNFNPDINTGTVVSSGVGGSHVDCLTVSGLSAGTVYAIRAWAYSSLGYTYSDVVLFTVASPAPEPPEVGDAAGGGIIVSIEEEETGYYCLIASDILSDDPMSWFQAKHLIFATYGFDTRADVNGNPYNWFLPRIAEAGLVRAFQQSFVYPDVSPLDIPTNNGYWTSYFFVRTYIAPFRTYHARYLNFSHQGDSELVNAVGYNYHCFAVKYYWISKE